MAIFAQGPALEIELSLRNEGEREREYERNGPLTAMLLRLRLFFFSFLPFLSSPRFNIRWPERKKEKKEDFGESFWPR